MIGFLVGIVASNAVEWAVHKYVLHGVGKKKSSYWSFHWNEHHRASRKHGFYDADYTRSPFGDHAQGKEVHGLLAISMGVVPLVRVAPSFCAGIWVSTAAYYAVHRKSHLDPAWARKYLPWHYDHHMAPDQDKNWCVTFPLFDYLLGTREKYVGTAREQHDLQRVAARRQARAAARQQQTQKPAPVPQPA
ncbi:MAG TPA: hypothetical protein ENK23_06645 [Sorangium sp.]|nr:hypothetical protein [Sorangium sp.]